MAFATDTTGPKLKRVSVTPLRFSINEPADVTVVFDGTRTVTVRRLRAGQVHVPGRRRRSRRSRRSPGTSPATTAGRSGTRSRDPARRRRARAGRGARRGARRGRPRFPSRGGATSRAGRCPPGGPCAATFTLTPIPSTTRPSRASARMPAVLRPPIRMSFGSLISGARPVTCAIASAHGLDPRRASAPEAVRSRREARAAARRAGSLPGGDSQRAPEPSAALGLLLGQRDRALGVLVSEQPLRRRAHVDEEVRMPETPAQRWERRFPALSDEVTANYTRPPVPTRPHYRARRSKRSCRIAIPFS